MSIGEGDNHVRVNNYLFAQYLNSTDNSVGSGVTGVMVKAGDNYFRTGTAAAVLSFLGVTAPTGDNLGNHTATTTLNMNANVISNFRRIEPFGIGANSGEGSNAYAIFQEGGAWTFPYPDLRIAYHTGIKLGANPGYNGIRFYNDYDMATQTMSVNDGDNNVRIYYDLRVPLIYDMNNTGYYWNGDGTSRMYYGDFNYLHTQVNDSWFPYTGNNWNYFRGNSYAWNATWYDENNTGYFIDPASTSRFYNINNLPGFDGYYPSNSVIRHTPNLHFNSLAGYAVIVNWDNGTSGASQTFRTTGDGFYVYADGQTFCSNWFRPLGTSGLYFQSYGGGWHMTDATWIRAYNSKPILANGGIAGYGNAIGTWYGIGANMMANYNNAAGAGIVISDDGGFGDYNDGWVEFRGSTGISLRSDNTSWDMLFRMYQTGGGGPYDKRVAPDANGWGLLGASGNAWYQTWSYAFNNASQREIKKDITPVKGSLSDLVMADLDKMTPYLYRYNVETDEWSEQSYAKYRTGLHMGLILDETPDYIQSQSYNGVDVYAVASLGVAAGKHNREEIKQIKESIGLNEQTMNIQDFGSAQLNGKETYITFAPDFSSKLGSVLPAVTVTSSDPSVTLSVIEKSAEGFKVISSGSKNVAFDYIAMAKVKNTMVEPKQEIPAETMKRIRVDQSDKDKVIQFWKDEPKREAERLAMEQEKAHTVQEQRKKELALPDGYIGPDKTPLHNPKLNDADTLIKEYNEKLKQQPSGPAPATPQLPADAPAKETGPAELNQQHTSPR